MQRLASGSDSVAAATLMADLTTVDWQHSIFQTLAVGSCEALIDFG
jgi:hypothetical protein